MYHLDPRKVIKASLSQADVVVFGKNTGQQCAAMNVCALLHHNMKGILSTLGDLKQVTHNGNQL